MAQDPTKDSSSSASSTKGDSKSPKTAKAQHTTSSSLLGGLSGIFCKLVKQNSTTSSNNDDNTSDTNKSNSPPPPPPPPLKPQFYCHVPKNRDGTGTTANVYYDPVTNGEIEQLYQLSLSNPNKEQRLPLTHGTFFSRKPGQYCIIIDNTDSTMKRYASATPVIFQENKVTNTKRMVIRDTGLKKSKSAPTTTSSTSASKKGKSKSKSKKNDSKNKKNDSDSTPLATKDSSTNTTKTAKIKSFLKTKKIGKHNNDNNNDKNDGKILVNPKIKEKYPTGSAGMLTIGNGMFGGTGSTAAADNSVTDQDTIDFDDVAANPSKYRIEWHWDATGKAKPDGKGWNKATWTKYDQSTVDQIEEAFNKWNQLDDGTPAKEGAGTVFLDRGQYFGAMPYTYMIVFRGNKNMVQIKLESNFERQVRRYIVKLEVEDETESDQVDVNEHFRQFYKPIGLNEYRVRCLFFFFFLFWNWVNFCIFPHTLFCVYYFVVF